MLSRGVIQSVALGIAILLSAAFPGATASARQAPGPVAQVGGTVRTRLAGPLPMARVTLRSYSGGLPQSTLTDRFGQFSFDRVPVGSYEIVVRAFGYAPARRSIEVSAAGPMFGLFFTLRPTGNRNSAAKRSPNGSSVVSVRQLRIPGKARREYQEGLDCAARGKTGDAIKHWKKSIRIFPPYAESYMQLSKVYANRGDFADATSAANHAVQLDGKSADPYRFLGYVYVKEKRFPNAEAAFARAVRLSDSDWLSQFWLGKLLLEEKRARKAYPHLLRASQVNPEIPEIDIALYNDLLMLARPKGALARLDDFLNRFPKNPLAAVARAKRKQLRDALSNEKH